MIELSGIRVPLVRAEHDEYRALEQAVAQKLHIRPHELISLDLKRRSIDARKKNNIQLVYSVTANVRDKAASVEPKEIITWPAASPSSDHSKRIIVIGAGCAGLFCTLALAKAGASPLLLERGDAADRRTQLVIQHNACGTLDTESNIQFGLGGAGTFSDGKLTTGTKSPYHQLILKTFVECGADASILYDAHPHIGSDVLPAVVSKLVDMIRAAGGEVRFRTRVDELVLSNKKIAKVRVSSNGITEEIAASHVVLATGHSARDIYEHVHDLGITLERKTFAMGVRIEHTQAQVDSALYGHFAGHPLLGAAPYKGAVQALDGRSAFTFCMCPGGEVVSATSEQGAVCTNGASLQARAGTNANAGLLANVFPQDLKGEDVLAGIKLQRACEQAAYKLGGGNFIAPAQLVGDFLNNRESSVATSVTPTYPRGVSFGEISSCLPSYITQTLQEALPLLACKLSFFSDTNAVLTAVETRSSSPVRLVRDSKLMQSVSVQGLYPVGEGAGYAGGIMSAATDGIRAAAVLLES